MYLSTYYKNSTHLSAKPNGKVVKHFLGKEKKKKRRENCHITDEQLTSISAIELAQDDQFERLNWLLSIIASILLVNVTVVIMVNLMIFKLYSDHVLTSRKIVQHKTKGKLSSLIIPSNFRLTELKRLVVSFF
jgi:hypothetical protein